MPQDRTSKIYHRRKTTKPRNKMNKMNKLAGALASLAEAAAAGELEFRETKTNVDPSPPGRGCYTLYEVAPTIASAGTGAAGLPRVEATFVITMSDNPDRIVPCLRRVFAAHPTPRYFVLVNEGFRSCTKHPGVVDSAWDIQHANLEIFRVARRAGMETILVLEDDCLWAPDVSDGRCFADVQRFLDQRGGHVDHYFLGCSPVPFHTFPLPPRHWRVTLCAGAHAVVHTKRGMDKYRSWDDLDMSEHHVDALFSSHDVSHMYWRPLALQTWPADTENSATWDTPVTRFLRSAAALDTKPEPGTSCLYVLSLALPLLALIVLVAVVVAVARRLRPSSGRMKYFVDGM